MSYFLMYAFRKKKREKCRVSPLNPWTLTKPEAEGLAA